MKSLSLVFMVALFTACGFADMPVIGSGAVSGDTAIVTMSNGFTAKVKIVGVAAPRPGQERFRESMDFLAKKIYNVKLTLVGEVKGPSESDTTYTAVILTEDGKDVGLSLVAEGWAWARQEAKAEYITAQAAAKVAKKGLWADKNPKAPWRWKKGR